MGFEIFRIGDFKFLPFEEAINPTRGQYFERLADRWWTVHPELGLAFFNQNLRNRSLTDGWRFPQCNESEIIARRLSDRIGAEWAYEVRFVPLVWVPISPRMFRE